MAEQTLTRNFAELDLTRIYLKYATLDIDSAGDEEAYYGHQLHSGELVKGFSDIGTSEERRRSLL
jgi:hypothetical protein